MGFLNSLLPNIQHFGVLGYWLVLFIALFESLVIVGTAIPGSIIIIFVGFLSSKGYFEFSDLLWFVTIGAILGDVISYYLGTKGTKFFKNENKILKTSYLEFGERFFHKHGNKSILLARFVGPLRPLMPFIAGLSAMDKKRFFFWDIISAFLWSALHLLIGYFFGNALVAAEVWSTRAGYAAVIIIIFLLLVFGLRFIIVKHGKKIANFIGSLSSSIWQAIILNPEVQKLLKQYPHFFSFIKNRLSRQTFFGLPLTLLMISFIYVLSLFLGVAQSILASDTIISIDLQIANLLAFFRAPGLTKIFLWITLLGNWQFIITTTLIISLILWLWKKKTYLIYFWAALSIDILLNHFSKLIIHRNRPINPVYLESSFSFPSGHAMIAIIFYGFLGYILIRHSKNWARKVNLFFLCLIIILAIGFSRLYLGVHYLSDVWAGYLLSILLLITTIAIYKWRYFQKEKIENENIAVSKKIKTLTTVLIFINIVFYVGFALQYHPRLITPPQISIQTISGDVIGYFNEHKIPKYSESLLGNPQEPLSFIFLADNDETLIKSFQNASWFLADKANLKSIFKTAWGEFFNTQYLTAPMTPSFWNAAVNDFGFEKPTKTNTVRERHHIRIWKTNLKQNNLSVYVGTASLDAGTKWLVTHRINPDIDTEKLFVKDSLNASGAIVNWQELQFVDPTLGTNFASDAFFTNGKLYLIDLSRN